jgi:hypothetical protein
MPENTMSDVDETARQSELDGQHLVDSLPEAAFQDIVTLAALICDAPIALVTLIDRDRQWFKASTGLDVTGTRHDEAFCNHAIATPDQMMEVPDAHDDARFTANRMVAGPMGIRYYAGMPLVSPKGAAFGTVCVLNRQPRFLDEKQKGGLGCVGATDHVAVRSASPEATSGARRITGGRACDAARRPGRGGKVLVRRGAGRVD